MSYPGDPTLDADAQERLQSTYEEMVELAIQGKDQEAILGCEFVVRMDAEHKPARALLDKLVGKQQAAKEDGGLEELEPLEDLEDLGDLGDLDSFEDLQAAPPPVEVPPATASGVSGLGVVLQDLLARRNFSQVLQIAETQKQAIIKDPQLQAMVEEARERHESEAFVTGFLDSARQARDAGNLDEASKILAKVQALDPGHPELAALTSELAVAGTVDSGPSGEEPEIFQTMRLDAVEMDESKASLFDEGPASDAPAIGDDTQPWMGAPEPASEPASASTQMADDTQPALFSEAETADTGSFRALDLAEEEPAATLPAADSPPEEPLSFEESPAEDSSGGEAAGGRVGRLLAEGQAAFDEGEYQAAIDVWSRIFLIDLDNEEASQRIDKARDRKAELERSAEQLFHEGVGLLERQDTEAAQAVFQKVLQKQPQHALAREYLDELEAGRIPDVAPVMEDEAQGDDSSEAEDSEFPMLVEAGGDQGMSMEAAVARDRIVAVKKADRRLVALAGVGVLLILAGGGFLVSKWDDLFPNSKTPSPAQAPPAVDLVARASEVYAEGNVEGALSLLGRVPPGDPGFEKAQELTSEWRAAQEAAEEEPVETGPSPEEIERFELILTGAREAHGQRRYLRSQKYFEQAAKMQPLGDSDGALLQDARKKLEPLANEIGLYEQGSYSQVIPNLWRRFNKDGSDHDVRRLLVDAYYNLVLRDLQRGNTLNAAQKLGEVREVDPENRELQRLELFAKSYVDRPQDLTYRIFVKYLPSR